MGSAIEGVLATVNCYSLWSTSIEMTMNLVFSWLHPLGVVINLTCCTSSCEIVHTNSHAQPTHFEGALVNK